VPGRDALRSAAAPRIPGQLTPTDLGSGVLVDDGRLDDVRLGGRTGTGTVARAVSIGGARLTGSLAGARLPALHLHDVEATGADIANLDAPRAELRRVVFRDCRLTGAQLARSSLSDVIFAGCRLDLAVLADATLERVSFSRSVLADATFERAILRDVSFEECDFTGTSLDRIRLQRVELTGCRLEGMRSLGDLRGARMPWPDVVGNAGAFAGALGIEVLDAEQQP
jgi:uncharacterized protein YjbI with pentapeptide repeats